MHVCIRTHTHTHTHTHTRVCVYNSVALDPAAHISGVVWHEDPAQGALMGYRDNPKYATRSSLTDDRRTTMLDRCC